MAKKLCDTVVIEPPAKPEAVLECLIDAVNYAWHVQGENGRCSVPANFVGWLIQQNERLQEALEEIDQHASLGSPPWYVVPDHVIEKARAAIASPTLVERE